MIWLQENWIIAAIVAVLALIIIAFLLRRPKADDTGFGDDYDAAPAAKTTAPPKPLAPNKPDIIAAEPARFKPIEPSARAASAPFAPAPSAELIIEPARTPPIPVADTAPPPAASVAQNGVDNLRLMKGIGPKLATLLGTLGVSRFEQIAAWTDADVARIDPQLGSFQGRIQRDNWVDQAGYLARGDKTGFEAKYGALGGEI